MIKAVLHDFSCDCSTNSWTGHTELSMEIAKQMTLVKRLLMFVHIISYKWIDGKSR